MLQQKLPEEQQDKRLFYYLIGAWQLLRQSLVITKYRITSKEELLLCTSKMILFYLNMLPIIKDFGMKIPIGGF